MMQQLIDENLPAVKFVKEEWGVFKFEGGILDGKTEALPCEATERTKLIYGDRVNKDGHKIDVLKFFYIKKDGVFVLESIKAIQREFAD